MPARHKILSLLALALALAGLCATSAAGAPRTDGHRDVALLVKFQPGTTGADRARLLRAVEADREGTVRKLGVQVVSVEAADAASALRRLRASGRVAYVERDRIARATDIVPNDPFYVSMQWPVSNPEFEVAWDTTTGDDVVVAVLDTGVNPVADLGDALLSGY